MSKDKDDFYLENWEESMKDWLLDPATVQLDEQEFRVDFLDTTESFILEIETENICPEELIIKKKDTQLLVSIMLKDECKIRKRSIRFPFCLKQRAITYSIEHHTIEINVPKKECSTPSSYVIRVQGLSNE
ncbi:MULTISPECIES: Hsp20/alpha crystallin family protein [Bacillaceae]|uniref:Hsp20/alpha crystallin family protein n=1 Tax=Bacillaceae TaxID=186817 RepID=UPI001C5A1C10|nr:MULTISPECIES: Hsp20/alpha crystallin family protein [Rossellomorea]MBW3114546.1 Hsp20/alpha crystallin family protein [Bacillus sp. MCCB 382]MDX8344335.1 Hsp20/alpha crystallin family protein [Rossellomorea sp. YZS02]